MRVLAATVQLALGAAFGAALLRSGASDFDAMVRMFLFEEGHIFGLALVTTVVAAIGLFALARAPLGQGVRMPHRAIQGGSIVGGALFGVGWGISGSCPGTVLAQLGHGHLIALATLLGVLLGNLVFDRWLARRFGLPSDSCT
jgi:uncharacterized protein